MTRRLPRWPNSILAHMLALCFSTIIVMTTVSIAILSLRDPPQPALLTVREVVRLLGGKAPISSDGEIEVSLKDLPPPRMHLASERVLASLVASGLGVDAKDVRLHIDGGGLNISSSAAVNYAVSQTESELSRVIFGPFTVAVRKSEGGWLTLQRRESRAVRLWRLTSMFWLVFSIAATLPIAWWFSLRLARPIRNLSRVAEQVGDGKAAPEARVEGPTEIRLAAFAINEMQARIARYVKERTSVVGAIAHDMRTPLSRLHFHLASATPDVRANVECEIREMEQMIAMTLDFVATDTETLAQDPIDLGLLVEGVVDDFADMGTDVKLETSEAITVSGDQLQLRRMFANVIDNAVKYGKSARLRVHGNGGMALVDIEDHGPGMSDNDRQRAFEPFFRGERSRSRQTGGVGLGLAIVKSIAEAHRGHASLATSSTGGLLVQIAIPCTPHSSAGMPI